MARKPEIQYIGQFYVHGSEVKKLAVKEQPKKAKTELPLHRIEKVRKVYVDPLAICSLVMAAVLLVTMAVGALSLEAAWQELDNAQQYVFELQHKQRVLESEYRSGYDLEEIRSAALAMGMIPAGEAETMNLRVTVPQQEPEMTWMDEMVWFLEGLFA